VLIVEDLGYIDELGKRDLRGGRDQILLLLRRKAGEVPHESLEDHGVVAPLVRQGLDDGEGLSTQQRRLLLAELLGQGSPSVDPRDRVLQVDGWIYQEVLLDTNLSLGLVDDAQIGTLERAQARAEKADAGGLHVVSGAKDAEDLLHRVIQVARIVRGVAGNSASTRGEGEIPAHRRGEDDDVVALAVPAR